MGTNWKPEEVLQGQCAAYLRSMCPDVLWWASMNGIWIGANQSRFQYMDKMKKIGLLAGVPDLQICFSSPNGPQTCFIELKANYNKPTEDQQEVMGKLKALGFKVDWTNSLEGFIKLLTDFGVPTRSYRGTKT